jgi:hypothetical protein
MTMETETPHSIQIVVWDLPSAIECGEKFSLKLGAKCTSECRPDNWTFVVTDHDGNELAVATTSDQPWPDTAALYYAEVEFEAPQKQGEYSWVVRVPATDMEIQHSQCTAEFKVQAVPAPECVLTVEAIDLKSQTPVQGAKVVAHPYRTLTDEHGLAEIKLPKGEYRLFVSGKNYFPFRSDNDVQSDIKIRAELTVDQELSDVDVWI